jgi:hypothetical protein
MAINTFSHAILSASLVSYPELAEGSGIHAVCTTANVVSLTAGSEVITSGTGSSPLLSGGIGVVGHGIATNAGTPKAPENGNALSGFIGIEKLGAIGTHPVAQLLYNPPPLEDDLAGTNTASAKAGGGGPGGVAPMQTGTCSSKGYGNLNMKGAVCQAYNYALISPEDTETFSHWRPHLHHHGTTIISSSLSGITVALRTAHAQAGRSRHQVNGHKDSGIEVQYYLGDPLAAGACYNTEGLLVSAGLSSQHLGFVGPEHARKRLMGY